MNFKTIILITEYMSLNCDKLLVKKNVSRLDILCDYKLLNNDFTTTVFMNINLIAVVIGMCDICEIHMK